MKPAFLFAGVIVGMLMNLVERRYRVRPPGLLLLVYMAGFLVGCLVGG